MKLSLSDKKKLEIIRSLSTMIAAGIPLFDGVSSLINQVKGNEKIFLTVLRDDLNQGKTVAETFAKFPSLFDEVTISSIKIAEETGNIDTVFRTLTENLEKSIKFTDNLKNSLTYPAFVSVVFVFVTIFILVFIVPRITTVFYSLNVKVPYSAKLMIGASDLVIHYWYLFTFFGIFLFFMGYLFVIYRRKDLLRFFFSLPFVSTLGTQIDLANLSRNLNLLLATGVTMNRGLKLCESIVTKPEIVSLISQAEQAISEGKDLSYAFINNNKYIPDFMVLMIQTGERTGTLEKSMSILADYFENLVYNSIKKFSTLIEPAIIILIAIMVLIMLISVITPIYELVGTIGTA